ncbi:18S rRNA maturation protein [Kappamyces sp. JEL0680]|nr:18S rRNA maturation protein [Kappamyces sp. JEL0680]
MPKPTPAPETGKKSSTSKGFRPNPLAVKYGHAVHKKEKHGLNGLKKQLRDATRSLKKAMSSDKASQLVKRDLEAKVKALGLRIAQAAREQKEKTLAEKYKYVRFVGSRAERKKVGRKLKKADPASDEFKRLELELLYTKFYPVDLKYIALYPSKEDETKEDETKEDEEPKHAEKSAKRQKEILARLDELRSQGHLDTPDFTWRWHQIDTDDHEQDGQTEEAAEAEGLEQDDFFV